jgi:hypothetical protein
MMRSSSASSASRALNGYLLEIVGRLDLILQVSAAVLP